MENITQPRTDQGSRTTPEDQGSTGLAEVNAMSLKVKDIMSHNVVTAAPVETLLSAAARMSDHAVSCVIVIDDDKILGILTERDILREATHGIGHVGAITVADAMSNPVVTIDCESRVLDAGAIMTSKSIKRLVVVEEERLCAVLTQTDVTRGLISMAPIRDVASLMSTDIASVDASALVAEAVEIMASRHISAIVAMGQQEPVGILTEKDVLRQIVARRRDPCRTVVRELMSHPVVSVPPSHSIISACQMMDDKRIHRVVVMDHGQACGIVSQTDVLDALLGYIDKTRADRSHGQATVISAADGIASKLSTIDSMVRRVLVLAEQAATDAPRQDAACPGPRDCRVLSGIQVLQSVEDLIGQCKDELWQITRQM